MSNKYVTRKCFKHQDISLQIQYMLQLGQLRAEDALNGPGEKQIPQRTWISFECCWINKKETGDSDYLPLWTESPRKKPTNVGKLEEKVAVGQETNKQWTLLHEWHHQWSIEVEMSWSGHALLMRDWAICIMYEAASISMNRTLYWRGMHFLWATTDWWFFDESKVC